MNRKLSQNLTIFVVVITAISLLLPQSFLWLPTSSITPLLGIIMFGMGLTLKPVDFKPLLLHPRQVIIGELAQFIIMPGVALILCRLFHLPTELALGVILVGCCPGGTASNLMTYLANGDVAFSVAMTSVSTLIAPIVTPALVLLLAGKSVDVYVAGMFLSILQVIILPIAVGIIINNLFGKFTERIVKFLPSVSTLAIAVIVGVVVSHNAQNVIHCSLLVMAVVVVHNLLGMLLGYTVGHVCGFTPAQRSAVSIEVGMQNSGLATSLATTHFALFPMAAVPGAIFSIWHNISGSLAAQIFSKQQSKSTLEIQEA